MTSRVVLVVGSSGGLCRAILPHLAKQGFSLALVDIREPPKEFLDQLEAFGVQVFSQTCDIVVPDNIASVVQKAIDHFPQGIYSLIFAAGYFPPAMLQTESVENITKSFQINMLAPLLFARGVIPSMKKNQIGRIINFTSSTTHSPVVPLTVYSTMKTGLLGLTRGLSKEGTAEFGITVNSISPGLIRHPAINNPEEVFQYAIQAQTVHRALVPEDLFPTVDYLISPQNTTTTGQNINNCAGTFS